ncbi:hypothetical protein BH11PSE8_BH11PSE8_24380 [soil metagenome]
MSAHDLLALDSALERRPARPTMARSAARARKLHSGHFAFMRALVQGVALTSAWERYLHAEWEGSDLRLVRGTVTWIRAEFAAAAQREQRPGTARLIRLDLSKIPDPGEPLSTLDAFAEEHGLGDESQAVQVAEFEAVYGRRSARLTRHGRLIARQLEALRWLEVLVAQPPRAGDALAAWLHPSLSDHLEAADVFTIAQVMDRINGIGRRWYASIPALGAAKATRIVAWLRQHQESIGMALGAHVVFARAKLYAHELDAVVAPATDIRPLEKFIVPSELDGRHGLYRRPQAQCLLKASNDYQAILAWLRSKHGLSAEQKAAAKARRRQPDTGIEQGLDWLKSLSHTQRAYRKEAERFLLWATVHQGKALSSMTNEDTAYRDFLGDPQPRSRWCGARSRERWSPLWRPFEGPLSAPAQRHALTILKNLYGFLVDQNYLMGNPWSAVRVARPSGPKVDAGRSLTVAQWRFVQQQLDLLTDTSANRRLAFTLRLLYATGLRLSEVVAATLDDLVWVEYPADAADDDAAPVEGWLLRVIGKGEKLREVPVPQAVVDELKAYLESRSLAPEIADLGNQGAFLLGQASDAAARAPGLDRGVVFDPRPGIAASTLYRQLKGFFGACAAVLARQGDARGSRRLAQASTHWLRHSHASHAIAAGMPIEIAQQNLGHASLATTTVYVTTAQKKRMQAVAGFWEGATRGVGKGGSSGNGKSK